MRALTLVAVVVLGTSLGAQSLGDLARQEEARRKAIKQPAKTYTNDFARRAKEKYKA